MRALSLVTIGGLVSFAIFAALSAPYSSVDASEPSSIQIPVGSIGDVVNYTRFSRTGEGADWVPRTVESFIVEDERNVTDETGAIVPSIKVVWNQGPDTFPATTFIDLNTREVARRDHSRSDAVEGDGVSTSGPQPVAFWYSTSDFGPQLSPAWIDFSDPSLFWFQGESFAVGDLLTPDYRGRFANLWGLAAEDLSLFDSRIIEHGLVQGSNAVKVIVQGDAAVPAVTSSSLSGGWDDNVPFLTTTLSPGAKVQFSRTLWLTDSSPYPVLVEDSVTSSLDEPFHALLNLDSIDGGTVLIEWTAMSTGPVPSVERSPGDLPYPVAGQQDLVCLDLEAALALVERDPAFNDLQAWRAAHPEHLLLGFRGACNDNRLTYWFLTFADPSGRGYRVDFRDEPLSPAERLQARDLSWEGAVVTPAFDPDALSRGLVTFGHLQDQWSRFAHDQDLPAEIRSVRWGLTSPWWVEVDGSPVVSNPRDLGPLSDLLSMSTAFSRLESANGVEFWNTTGLTINAVTGQLEFASNVLQDDRPLIDDGSKPSPVSRPGWVTSDRVTSTAPLAWQNAAAAAVSTSFFALWLVGFFFPLIKYTLTQAAGLLPGYAKLRKEKLLDHKLRDELVDIIKADPGLSATDIAAKVDAGWSTVVYHLGVIERNGLVSSLIDTRHRRFFPVGDIPHGQRGRIAVLRNERTRTLLDIIRAKPGQSQASLGKQVGVSRPAVAWHLERLEHEGFITRRRSGRSVLVFSADAPAAAHVGGTFLPAEAS